MTETVDPLQLDEQVCFALVVAARTVVAHYKPILEPLGLTHPQYLVMLALWQHAPLTVTRLGHLLQLEPATLSPLLKRLESAGLVDRVRDDRDQRQLAVSLTDHGRALRTEALAVPHRVADRLGLSLPELKELHDVLRSVIDRVSSVASD